MTEVALVVNWRQLMFELPFSVFIVNLCLYRYINDLMGTFSHSSILILEETYYKGVHDKSKEHICEEGVCGSALTILSIHCITLHLCRPLLFAKWPLVSKPKPRKWQSREREFASLGLPSKQTTLMGIYSMGRLRARARQSGASGGRKEGSQPIISCKPLLPLPASGQRPNAQK